MAVIKKENKPEIEKRISRRPLKFDADPQETRIKVELTPEEEDRVADYLIPS